MDLAGVLGQDGGVRRSVLLSLALGAAALGCRQDIAVLEDAGRGRVVDAGMADVGGARDAGAADAGTTVDAGVGGAPDAAEDAGPADAGACRGNPFAFCEDPAETRPNNEWANATRFGNSVGCISGDDLTELDTTLDGRLCPNDPADFYALTVVPCDTRTLLFEMRLRPSAACGEDAVDAVFFSGGGRVGCQSDRWMVQCSRDGEDRVVRVQVPPGRSVLSWQLAVEALVPDASVDYALILRMR
jgi:hypothetical protein